MLNKVLKYDLKYMYKVLNVFYILAIIFALFTRMLWSIESTIFNFLGFLTSGITICLIFAIIIYNIMRSWVRFTTNIFKDESYLTHTLPITKNTIYLSKFISTFISLATSIIIIILAMFIAYYSKENLEFIKSTLNGIADIYDSTTLNILITMFIVFFLEVMSAIMAGYTGLLLGHRCSDAKMLKSIAIGFAFYIGTSLVLLGIVFFTGLFTQNILDLFITNTMPSVEMIKNLLKGAIILYTIIIIVFYIFDIHLFQRGVNID